MTPRLLALSVAAACAGLAACSADATDTDGTTATKSEALFNGIPVTQDNIGSVHLNTGCSGTLLSPWWVITAHHCVSFGAATTGQQQFPPPRLTVTSFNGTTVGVAQIVRHPVSDVAMVQLTAPLLNSSGRPFTTHLYRGTTASLFGTSLLCEGWGLGNVDGSGGGVLRSATLPISAPFQPLPFSTYVAGPSGQMGLAPGDSGSSCYFQAGSVFKATGIDSTGPKASIGPGVQMGVDSIRSWAMGIMGNAAAPGSPAALEMHDGITAVMYRNTNSQNLMALSTNGPGVAWTQTNFTTQLGAPAVHAGDLITTYVRTDGADVFVYRGSDNNIYEVMRNPQSGAWTGMSLKVSASASVFASGDPSGYIRSGQMNAVVYQGSDGHIHEFEVAIGESSWRDVDVSGPAAPGTDPVGYVRSDGSSAIVYLNGTDIWEASYIQQQPAIAPDGYLCPDADQFWQPMKLTSLVGAPPAMSPPRPYTRSDGVSAIVYLANNSHIIEISEGLNGWGFVDLTAAAGAANTTSAPVPYIREDGVNAVLYLNSTNAHLMELELTANAWQSATATWTRTDLTAAAPGSVNPSQFNPVGSGPIATGFIRGDGSAEILFQGASGHIYGIIHSVTTGNWAVDNSNGSTSGDLTPFGQ